MRVWHIYLQLNDLFTCRFQKVMCKCTHNHWIGTKFGSWSPTGRQGFIHTTTRCCSSCFADLVLLLLTYNAVLFVSCLMSPPSPYSPLHSVSKTSSHSFFLLPSFHQSLINLSISSFCSLTLADAGCYGLWAAVGLFCLSRHLRLLFRSQSRSGGVERVRGCPVALCLQICVGVCVCVWVGACYLW